MPLGNYIALNRKLRTHWLWQDKPFSKGQAWVDLLLRANFADTKILVKGHEVAVQRGQAFVSYLGLATDWGWDRKKVRRFLKTLEDCQMIARTPTAPPDGTASGTLVTLLNYGLFQHSGTPDAPPNAPINDPGSAHEMPTDRPTKCPPDGTPRTLAPLGCIDYSGTPDAPPTAPPDGPVHGPHLKMSVNKKGSYDQGDSKGAVKGCAGLPKR